MLPEAKAATLQRLRERDAKEWPRAAPAAAGARLQSSIDHVQLAFDRVECGIEGSDKPVRYTAGEHEAVRVYLAGLRHLTCDLFRVASEQRLQLELRVAELEARVGDGK